MVIIFEQHRLSNSFASHVLNFSGGSWACQLDTDRHRPRGAVAPSRCRYYPLLQCADFDAQPLHAWILDWALETRWQDETSQGMASNKLRLQRRSKSLKQNSLGAPDCATGWQAQNFTIFSVIFYRFFINQLRSHLDQAPSWMRLVMWWRNCWRTIWLAAWWQMAGMDSVIFQRYCTSRGSCAKSSTLQDFARCYRWHSCAAWTWIRPQPVLPSTIQILLVPQTWSECKWPKVFFWCPLTALAAVNTHNFTHGIPFHQAKFGYWKSEEVDRFQLCDPVCCDTLFVPRGMSLSSFLLLPQSNFLRSNNWSLATVLSCGSFTAKDFELGFVGFHWSSK